MKQLLVESRPVTEQAIEQTYNMLNKRCFNGRLRSYQINIVQTERFFGGRVTSLLNHMSGIRSVVLIEFSNFFDLTDDQLNGVVLHEMVHVSIIEQGLIDNKSHGRLFIQELKRVQALVSFLVYVDRLPEFMHVNKAVVHNAHFMMIVFHVIRGILVYPAKLKPDLIKWASENFEQGYLQKLEPMLFESDNVDLAQYPLLRTVPRSASQVKYSIAAPEVLAELIQKAKRIQ